MQVNNQDRPGIFNAIDINQPQCAYDPDDSNLQRRANSTAPCITGPGSPTSVQSTSAQSTSAQSTSAQSTSAQSTSIKSTTAPIPTQALQIEPVVCHDASNFPGHGDVRGSAVIYEAYKACKDWLLEEIGPFDAPLSKTMTYSGINYEFDVEWVAGCVTTASTENVWSPLGPNADIEDQCASVFYDCWTKCKFLTTREDVRDEILAKKTFPRR